MPPINTQSKDFVPSPCISQCCLDEEDVCVGCFRHVEEITGWHSAETPRRRQIIANCEQRKQVREAKLNPT